MEMLQDPSLVQPRFLYSTIFQILTMVLIYTAIISGVWWLLFIIQFWMFLCIFLGVLPIKINPHKLNNRLRWEQANLYPIINATYYWTLSGDPFLPIAYTIGSFLLISRYNVAIYELDEKYTTNMMIKKSEDNVWHT